MKALIFALAASASLALPALAEQSGGIAGRLVDITSGRPIESASIAIFRMPVRKLDLAVRTLHTDRNGNFSDITLDPGRYVVTTNAAGEKAYCIIDDVFGGQTTRLKIYSGANQERCVGPRVHSAIINPANTADEYVVRN